MRPALAATLLLASLAIAAPAQAGPEDTVAVQAARASTCAAFVKDQTRHRAAGGAAIQTPLFEVVWHSLLAHDPRSSAYMGKAGLSRIMFDNTLNACLRMRERSLGATMDAEYAQL